MNTLVSLKNTCEDDFSVEFDVLPSVDISKPLDDRQEKIFRGLASVEEQIAENQAKIDRLNAEIDRLTNTADGVDYMIAVASGIIAGVIDSIWVEEFSIDRANAWGNDKVENYVVKKAQKKGYQGDDISGAVEFLEGKYQIAADKATNDFGGGKQHHLRDFSHHPTPVGLFFSFLTQFTHKVYGTDVAGVFKVAELRGDDLVLIGKNLPEKITFGVINWFFHMISDVAGSSTSILQGKTGTGLPGPLVSLLKELSALPIFRNMNEKGYKEFSVWISKLFNGTLLGKRDENGKIVEAVKFDLRTEIGVAHELGRQAIPVVINECIVRGFYFIRHFYVELRDNHVRCLTDLKNINIHNTLPFKNRTVIRMLTISSGTFSAIDMADAAIHSTIKSGGFVNPAFLSNMVLRVNFVGIGRFAVAVGTDVGMGIERRSAIKQRSEVMSEIICASNVKLYYKNAELMCTYSKLFEKESDMFNAESNMWLEVENTQKSMDELYKQIEKVGAYYSKALSEMDKNFDEIEKGLPDFKKKNPELVDKILEILNS